MDFNSCTPVQFYSEMHDNLGQVTTSIYGSFGVGTSHTYNLHGWLTSISSINFKDSYKTLFEEVLHYADGNATPCYNGNISSMAYKSADAPNSYKGYRYTYDGLDRLTSARYCIGTDLSLYDYIYSETMTYNKNSAIASLTRTGKTNPYTNSYGTIDALSYTYIGNRLKSVSDDQISPLVYSYALDFKDGISLTTEYVYDDCGAITQDRNKRIALIDYDFNGMPTRIQFKNGNVTEYVYSAEGVKLKTIHRTIAGGIIVPYGTRHTLTQAETLAVDSITYVGNFEIDGNYCSKYYFANGYIDMGNTGSGTYHYTITDHLGNVRAVVDENGTLKQVNNYFAYGGLLNDVTTGADVQTHKYNGKELDRMHGLDTYDYGARNYDAVLGQFNALIEICHLIMNMVTGGGYVCTPVVVTQN